MKLKSLYHMNILDDINQRLERMENLLQAVAEAPILPENDLMTVPQVAEFLQVSKHSIYSKVHKEEIPYFRRKTKLYFSREAILKHLREGENG